MSETYWRFGELEIIAKYILLDYFLAVFPSPLMEEISLTFFTGAVTPVGVELLTCAF